MSDQILEKSDEIDKIELCKAVTHMKSENEEEHACNIKDMIPDNDYKWPWENKDATVATGLRRVTCSSDLDKETAARKEPIKDTKTIK